jgi:hypothetical protein
MNRNVGLATPPKMPRHCATLAYTALGSDAAPFVQPTYDRASERVKFQYNA